MREFITFYQIRHGKVTMLCTSETTLAYRPILSRAIQATPDATRLTKVAPGIYNFMMLSTTNEVSK